MVCLGKEGVASSGVLEVVDKGAKNEGHHFDILEMLPQIAHLQTRP